MRTGRLGTLFLLVIVSAACFPYRGRAQLPVPLNPIRFIDASTGSPVARVLVLPRYSSFSGASSLAGHGPGAGNQRYYLADSFVYEAGSPFAPSQPKSTGIVWGWFWAYTGKGVSLDGVLIVSPGYSPKWVWDLWGRDIDNQFKLSPLSADEAVVSLRRLANLLQKEVLSGEDKNLWSLGYGYSIEVRLSAEERKAVLAFISGGITDLSGASSQGLPNYCLNPAAGADRLWRSEALFGARRGLGVR